MVLLHGIAAWYCPKVLQHGTAHVLLHGIAARYRSMLLPHGTAQGAGQWKCRQTVFMRLLNLTDGIRTAVRIWVQKCVLNESLPTCAVSWVWAHIFSCITTIFAHFILPPASQWYNMWNFSEKCRQTVELDWWKLLVCTYECGKVCSKETFIVHVQNYAWVRIQLEMNV